MEASSALTLFSSCARPGPRRHAVNSVADEGKGLVAIRTSMVRSAPILAHIPPAVSARRAGRPSTRTCAPDPRAVAGGLLAFQVTSTPPGSSCLTGKPQEVVFPLVEHGS